MQESLEMNQGRTPFFQRDEQLEAVLKEINELISDLPATGRAAPHHPILFIVGCPRSGSTLLLQWLASLGHFAYPSNLIARFYANPRLGALIQQMLLDYDSANQLFDGPKTFAFSSSLGRTKGALAPSEFWYFWRLFFHFGEIQTLSESQLAQADSRTFVQKLADLETVYDKPLAMKGMILNWHLPFLDTLFPKALFINVEREPVYNAQSLYQARLSFFGHENGWFSYKPPAYAFLKDLSPLEQVAGQVHFTRQAVADGLSEIPAERKLTISYSEFCRSPESAYRQLAAQLRRQGYELPETYAGISHFDIKDTRKIEPEKFESLKTYCDYWEAQER